MTWHAELQLRYRKADDKTVLQHAHQGPLRVLQSLYPEGPGVCHNVLVHPPSGLVGGDVLDIGVQVASGAHALVTTPGATRFYGSDGVTASQNVRVQVADNARLEWLPLENIAYSGCQGVNALHMELAPTAQMIGWDVLALGLPAAGLPFERGSFTQHVQVPGLWLERGVIRADDHRLLNSALGLNGKRCLATLFLACGSAMSVGTREHLLEVTREVIQAHPLARSAGATCPNPQVMVVRVLAEVVEPAMGLLKTIWGAWRRHAWQLPDAPPRIWSV